MKFGFKIKGIQLGEVSIEEIEVNTELSMQEVIGMRKESEYLLGNMPKYINQLKAVVEMDMNTAKTMGKATGEHTEGSVVGHNNISSSVFEAFFNNLNQPQYNKKEM